MQLTNTPMEALTEMFGDEIPNCVVCDEVIDDDCFFVNDSRFICGDCFDTWEEQLEASAKAFANAKCRITGELPKFDKATEWTITPEEYAAGERCSNTENAYRTHCRHERTNYDSLIASLDRDDPHDQIFYEAIRARTDEMIEEEVELKNLIVNSDDDV